MNLCIQDVNILDTKTVVSNLKIAHTIQIWKTKFVYDNKEMYEYNSKWLQREVCNNIVLHSGSPLQGDTVIGIVIFMEQYSTQLARVAWVTYLPSKTMLQTLKLKTW